MTDVSLPAFRKGRQVDLATSVVSLRAAISALALSVALNTTAFGIAIPVFGRRLSELGYGVADLSLLTVSYAIAHFVAAPILGKLADRIGRKPIIAIALAGQLIANFSYLVVTDLASLIAVRMLAGFLEGGLLPASLAVIADVVPVSQRGRWLGVIMAAYGAAFVIGPVIGGALYDVSGFVGAFLAAAGLAVPGLVTAVFLFGETLTPRLRVRNRLQEMIAQESRPGFADILPRPKSTFAILLLAAFTPMFVLTYVEPQFIFFSYDVLGWSTVQVGLILFAYGFAIMSMQLVFGGISDRRFERRWVIAAGVVTVSAFYWGMTSLTNFHFIFLAAALSGIGQGIMTPALDGFVFDLTPPHRRASVMGMRAPATSFGAVAGPALAFPVSGRIEPTTLFASAGSFVLVVGLIAALGLRAPRAPRLEVEVEAYRMRSLAAAAALRGLAARAATACVN